MKERRGMKSFETEITRDREGEKKREREKDRESETEAESKRYTSIRLYLRCLTIKSHSGMTSVMARDSQSIPSPYLQYT